MKSAAPANRGGLRFIFIFRLHLLLLLGRRRRRSWWRRRRGLSAVLLDLRHALLALEGIRVHLEFQGPQDDTEALIGVFDLTRLVVKLFRLRPELIWTRHVNRPE